ncbi:MAG TPA: hypothetical protein GX730_05310 [Chloroflexi bacterium]|nr:hypothetical protein [Ruminiclostridium sp.]HHX08832.1 hypothetical protein [Chloroflexota bacterium]
MQDNNNTPSKSLMSLPRSIAVIVSLVCVILLIVPILSGNSDFKKNVDNATNLGFNDLDDVKLSDLKDISLSSYGLIYYKVNVAKDDSAILAPIIMFLPGALAVFALLAALGRRPILLLILTAGILGSFLLATRLLADTGLYVGGTHKWGIAYYAYFLCIALLVVSSIWLFITKSKWKRAKRHAS